MNKIIGITGGVGSGKSTVVQILEKDYGAKTLIADAIGHEVFTPGSETRKEIIRHFGEQIKNPDGTINHATLAEIIFQDEKEKEYINSIVHPYVLDRIKNEAEIWRSNKNREDEKRNNNNENNKNDKTNNLLIIETALMFETGCDKLCEEVWGVITDNEIRIDRLMKTRGYSREKAEAILQTQKSNEELTTLCNRIIHNDGDMAELNQEIKTTLNRSATGK